ncbi:hypothetical protein CDAR_479761 [Caerostris darwini]|uniref:Uncharacterized protein n=1 Tax=Caerostris darwini TaxID=1538125 RepID=A0AAV4ST09_9ARAC|nr:hypothetical protein CDAR_479761 [Caerostris darwini]
MPVPSNFFCLMWAYKSRRLFCGTVDNISSQKTRTSQLSSSWQEDTRSCPKLACYYKQSFLKGAICFVCVSLSVIFIEQPFFDFVPSLLMSPGCPVTWHHDILK